MSAIEVEGCTIKAQAGATLAQVAKAALEHGLTGLEFASGIPGTVGGGVVMNAGAYGGEMKDVLVKCRHIDKDGNVIESWISGKTAHRIEKLAVGTYILREESAPFGYRIAEEVEFTVMDTNEIQKVTMKDGTPKGKIIINKTDEVTGKPIAGVEQNHGQ